MLIRATMIWLVILVFAVLNGVLREAVLFSAMGKAPGFITSAIILGLLIFATAYFSLSWIGASDSKQLFLIGFLWLMLTLAFEFSFGFARGVSLDEILSAYSFKEGNIWPLVLLVTFFAPFLAAKVRFRSKLQ
ncbi:MAG TPA: hypothetical protein PLR83_01785 [Pyrinomonadaceae bacterium]|nr:hypothetical protein [Pyrinomonadaceae bacterium]